MAKRSARHKFREYQQPEQPGGNVRALFAPPSSGWNPLEPLDGGANNAPPMMSKTVTSENGCGAIRARNSSPYRRRQRGG